MSSDEQLRDRAQPFAADAMRAAGLPASELNRVQVHPAGSELALRSLVEADGRHGADGVWTAAVTAAVGLSQALVAASLRADDAVLSAQVALHILFLDPLQRLADARPGMVVCDAGDGTLAVQAPTEAHRELAVACCGGEAAGWDHAVRAWASSRAASEAAAELQDFGVPAFAVGSATPADDREVVRVEALPTAGDGGSLADVTVIELGGLWAAPLAAQLLAGLGARVVKIEAPMRPDGARTGPAAHFEALNRGKTVLKLDLRRPGDHGRFVSLLGPRTVVIENFSDRVLGNLGLLDAIQASGAALIRLPASRLRPDWRGLGSSLELAAGLGRPGGAGGLTCAPIPLTDPLSGVLAALNAVAAIRGGARRRVVGQLEDVAGVVAAMAAAS